MFIPFFNFLTEFLLTIVKNTLNCSKNALKAYCILKTFLIPEKITNVQSKKWYKYIIFFL